MSTKPVYCENVEEDEKGNKYLVLSNGTKVPLLETLEEVEEVINKDKLIQH